MFLEQANVDLDIICKTEFSSCRRTLQLKNGEWIWGPAEHIYVDVVCCYFVAQVLQKQLSGVVATQVYSKTWQTSEMQLFKQLNTESY